MMTCEHCRDILSELLEGDLPASVEAQAREHLARCPECARELAEFRALVTALHSLPEVEPPAELRARLRTIPERAARGGWRRARFIATSMAAAAAALLIVWTGITHYQGRPGVDLTTAPSLTRSAPTAAGEEPVPAPTQVAEEEAASEVSADGSPAAVNAPASEVSPASPAEAPATAAQGVAKSVPELAESAAAEEEELQAHPVPAEPSTQPESGARSASIASPGEMMAMEALRGPAAAAGPAGPAGAAPAPDAMAHGGLPGTLPVPDPLYLDARGPGPATTDTGEGSPFVISVVPPRVRVVDEIVAATITLETEKAVERAQLNVQASPGLELVDVKPDGELFEGPLRAGQETVLSLHMQAREPGPQAITMRLRSTDPVVDTRLAVRMGEFVAPVPAAERPVQFSFTDTPIDEAAAELTRQSGLRIRVAPECTGRAVTVSAPDPIPARAAVRSVAAAAGCAASEQGEVMVIEPAQE